jgi:hypothetical protein
MHNSFPACAKCHEVPPPSGGAVRKVTKTNIADRWVHHGPFTHLPHRHMSCNDCHGAAHQSQATSDILMPPQTLCAECHRRWTRSDCSKWSGDGVAPKPGSPEMAEWQRHAGGVKWECQALSSFPRVSGSDSAPRSQGDGAAEQAVAYQSRKARWRCGVRCAAHRRAKCTSPLSSNANATAVSFPRPRSEQFIDGYTRGDIPDYQASAFAMAVFFRGLNAAETGALTRAMMRSGRTLQYPAGSPPKVDKHSTGGIGDKVSLVLAPLLACDDLWVPMISGRGLGITGGTLDKLESIPGFNVLAQRGADACAARTNRSRHDRQTGRHLPGGQEALRFARCHRDLCRRSAHRRQYHEQEARGITRPAGARCEIREWRFYENARGG